MNKLRNIFTATAQHRFAGVGLLGLLIILLSTITRISLTIKSWQNLDHHFISLITTFSIGFFYDVVTTSYILIPLALIITITPNILYQHRLMRPIWIGIYFTTIFIMCFTAIAEWVFWDEFSSRFNFIAVDYLIYTTELIGNIRQSYPVGKILTAVAIIAGLITWLHYQLIKPSFIADPNNENHTDFWERIASFAILLIIPIASYIWLDNRFKEKTNNHYSNELAGNGTYEFFAAFRNNELDYNKFYPTLPIAEVFQRLRNQLETPHAKLTSNKPLDFTRTVDYQNPEKKLNVILISVESLSADFMQSFGNTNNITPNLDALTKESLFFTNLYANGTRTVRGLEALSLSIPPTPGQSIVKRPTSKNLATIGQIFRDKQYNTKYIYGGYGYFDNMNAFFSENGYDVVDRNNIPANKIHQENIWGIADEDLFTRTIEEMDNSFSQKKLAFFHVMTTTNHRPYTYPDGRIDLPSKISGRNGAVKYTDWAIADFLKRAKTKPWFDDTIFVIVADHCASSAGKSELPVDRYHIPLFIYAPKHIQPAKIERHMSQIDIVPTILGLLKFKYQSKFFGYDIFDLPEGRERMFVSTYQALGYIKGEKLITLRPKIAPKTSIPDFETGKEKIIDNDTELAKDAIAWYQGAAYAYKNGLLSQTK